MEKIYKFKEATLKRCKVFVLDAKQRERFIPISLELFHFLYQAKKIDFSLYFRVQDKIVEFIKPNELCKELLDEVWDANQKPVDGMEVCILKKDRQQFDSLIDSIRGEKIDSLKRKFPNLDPKTLDLYNNLSAASQMIVSGGIDAKVVAAVKGAAAFLVSNVIDSDASISTLSRMITCDPTLYDHSATVAMIASVISLRLMTNPMTTKQAEVVSQCALYHDVGKTCVPNAILNKPGKLTHEEFEIMKQHTTLGHVELERVIDSGATIDQLAARVAREHHEKWDGKGYPDGKIGAYENDPEHGIHLYTRIVTISDIYSALLMKRVYKPAFEPQDAIKVMVEESRGFDPDIFKPFVYGVVSSLNTEQRKEKSKGRILVFEENGELKEWTDTKKIAG